MKWFTMILALVVLLSLATHSWAQRRFVAGGPMSGTLLPGTNGGMIIGGPMNGVVLPPNSKSEAFFGEPMDNPPVPGIGRGMVLGERPVRPPESSTNKESAADLPTNGLPLALP
jgi:hypothetical protein